MPKLLHSSEKAGYGATIQLDSGDVCILSVAQAGVRVRALKAGTWNAVVGSFFGSVIYDEKNVYKAAKTAMVLNERNVVVPALNFQNPVLSSFAHAIWRCSSPGEVAAMLNEAS